MSSLMTITSHGIFETNSNSCEVVYYGKSLVSAFQVFFVALTKFSIWQGDWALGYHFMEFKALS